ncbi:MAG: sensor histidine kinase [Chloroflexota bacterium]
MQNAIDTISQRYRLIAIVIYIGTLVLLASDWVIGRPPNSPILNNQPVIRILIVISVLMILLLMDLHATNVYTLKLPRNQNRIYLAVHVLLLMVTIILAGLPVAMFTYILLLLYAYLTTGRSAALVAAGLNFIALFFRLAYGPNNDFISNQDLQQLVNYCLMTIFALFVGYVIAQEAESREQTDQLLVDLTDSNQKLKRSMEQVAELAASEERNRLARNIHDGLGHHLAAINIQLEMVKKLYDQQPEMAKEAVTQAQTATQAALGDVRQSVSTLRNGSERFQLDTALATLINRVAHAGLQINHEINGDEQNCPQPILLTFYRAAQEGMTNTIKHASATEINLQIDLLADHATLLMTDNGVGFDVETLTHNSGHGLQGIRERVALVKGRMELDSSHGNGTKLYLTIPYETSALQNGVAKSSSEKWL